LLQTAKIQHFSFTASNEKHIFRVQRPLFSFFHSFHIFHPFHHIRAIPQNHHPDVETHAQVNGVENVENTDESGRGDPSTAASAHPSVTGMRMPH
jgi:hypothetical protein